MDVERIRAVLAVLLPAAAAAASAGEGDRHEDPPGDGASNAPSGGRTAPQDRPAPFAMPTLSVPMPPLPPPPPLVYMAAARDENAVNSGLRWLRPGSDPELAKWIPVAYMREMEALASVEATSWYREMHRRVCDHFRDVQQRRVDELEAQIRAKEEEMRRKEEEKRERLRAIETRIREVEAEARLRRAQMELLQLEIRHLEVRLRHQELQTTLDTLTGSSAADRAAPLSSATDVTGAVSGQPGQNAHEPT